MKLPVDEEIIYCLARLIDDSGLKRRDPSHSDIQTIIQKNGLSEFDPSKPGAVPVGKEKRVKHLLIAAIENKPQEVERFAVGLLSTVKACGGFITSNPNYVGKDNIESLALSLKRHGILLDEQGSISSLVLDNLSEKEFTEALNNYILRAKKGVEDAALLVGTSKDLMEAVAAHVCQEMYTNYSVPNTFPALLGQAFIALGLATPQNATVAGEHPRKAVERNLFELAVSINRLRNKQGTGHGRPLLPDLKDEEAKVAIESIGIVAEFLLTKLRQSHK